MKERKYGQIFTLRIREMEKWKRFFYICFYLFNSKPSAMSLLCFICFERKRCGRWDRRISFWFRDNKRLNLFFFFRLLLFYDNITLANRRTSARSLKINSSHWNVAFHHRIENENWNVWKCTTRSQIQKINANYRFDRWIKLEQSGACRFENTPAHMCFAYFLQQKS